MEREHMSSASIVSLKSTVPWNIFFPNKWSYYLYRSLKWQRPTKITLHFLENLILRYFFGGYLGLHNFVSMRKRGTRCIAPKLRGHTLRGPKLRGAQIEGSKTLRGKDWWHRPFSDTTPPTLLEAQSPTVWAFGWLEGSPWLCLGLLINNSLVQILQVVCYFFLQLCLIKYKHVLSMIHSKYKTTK